MAFPIYDTQEDVPEAFRADYAKDDDGKWAPVPDPELTKSVAKLETTITKVREDADTVKAAAAEATTAAETAKAEAVQAKAEADARKTGYTANELDDMKKKMQDDARAEVAADTKKITDENERLKGVDDENRTLRLDDKVKSMMLKNGVTADGVDALFKLEREQFDLTEDKVVKLVEHPASPVDEFIKTTLKERHPHYFEGSKATGGDSHSQGGKGGKLSDDAPTIDEIKSSPEEALRRHRAQQK